MIITIAGTLITCIGTGVAINQASKAKGYTEQIKFDVRKINLSTSVEQIKRAQDDIRALPTSSENTPRGIKPKEVISSIRVRFDSVLGLISNTGEDRDIRETLALAQQQLNVYESSVDKNAFEATPIYELQSLVQDAVSAANARIYQLEGKA
jgi:hypothetical protein